MSNDTMLFERLLKAPDPNIAVESTTYLVKTGENPNTFDMYSAGNNGVLKKAGSWLVIDNVITYNTVDTTSSLSFSINSSYDYSYNGSLTAAVRITDSNGVSNVYPVGDVILTRKTSYNFVFAGLTESSSYKYIIKILDDNGNVIASSLEYTFTTISTSSISDLFIDVSKGEFSLANTTTKNSVITSGYVQSLSDNSDIKLADVLASNATPPISYEGLTPTAEFLPNYSMVANCIDNRNVLKTDLPNINPNDKIGVILGTYDRRKISYTNNFLNINTVMSVNSNSYRLPISAKVNPNSISCNFPDINFNNSTVNVNLSGLNLRYAIITPNRVYVLGTNSYYADILGDGTLTGFTNDLNISQITSGKPMVVKIGTNVYVFDYSVSSNSTTYGSYGTPVTSSTSVNLLTYKIQIDGSLLYKSTVDLGLSQLSNLYFDSANPPSYFLLGDKIYISGLLSSDNNTSVNADFIVANINADDTIGTFSIYSTPSPVMTQPNSITVTKTNVYIFCQKYSNTYGNVDMEVISYKINPDNSLQIPTVLTVSGVTNIGSDVNVSQVVQNGDKTIAITAGNGGANSGIGNVYIYGVTFSDSVVTMSTINTTSLSAGYWSDIGVVVIKNKLIVLADYVNKSSGLY